jgi:hypothetical protein
MVPEGRRLLTPIIKVLSCSKPWNHPDYAKELDRKRASDFELNTG